MAVSLRYIVAPLVLKELPEMHPTHLHPGTNSEHSVIDTGVALLRYQFLDCACRAQVELVFSFKATHAVLGKRVHRNQWLGVIEAVEPTLTTNTSKSMRTLLPVIMTNVPV